MMRGVGGVLVAGAGDQISIASSALPCSGCNQEPGQNEESVVSTGLVQFTVIRQRKTCWWGLVSKS